ncbi:MAG: sulfatase-like hydrolase/transferase [Actinomycetota bacterium]|nr:sulfatase-like hydrolase/transferase [Actinomycetota bacterium]
MEKRVKHPGFLRTLLSHRDWVYLLSLLVPFTAYNLALKAYDVLASQSGVPRLASTFDLMRSDIFFNLGYALLWVGLFVIARRGLLRRVVVLLFHLSAVLVVIVTTSAHWYFRATGAALDYDLIALWLSKVLAYELLLRSWVVLLAVLLYMVLGPVLLTRLVSRWRGWQGTSPTGAAGISPGSLVLFLLALSCGSLSLLFGFGSASPVTPLAKDRFANVVLTALEGTTGAEEVTIEEAERSDADPVPEEHPAAHARLAQTPQTEKRNVVLIHLESTRAQSVTPYNEDLKTTPFLDELAKNSLLVERAHVIVPRSAKGLVAVNCGIEPALYPGPEFESGIPARCLPSLLKEQGYRTVFFQSTADAENDFWDGALVRNFGYEEFYPAETMDKEGFQRTNTFGYEDDIMLGPSERWLKAYGDEPFMAEYFTGTGHYGYECIPNRYGTKDFSEDEQLNRYLNCLRYLDFFVENLFDQYKRLGLYDDTIFVLYGDHGEGFKEHDRDMHGDTIWEEGLEVPLIIHDPKRFQNGERAKGLSSQIDILPTVVDLLGYEVENGEYPGYSLLHPVPEDRTLMFSCISTRRCAASLKGFEKYIHHFGSQPDEVFDLSNDPLEKRNLADEYSKEELDKRREELFAWRRKVDIEHGDVLVNGILYSDMTRNE